MGDDLRTLMVTLQSSVSEMQKSLTTMKAELTDQIASVKTDCLTALECRIKKTEDAQVETNKEVTKVKEKISNQELQITEIQAVIIRQDQIISECKNQIEELQGFTKRKNIIISGLKLKEGNAIGQVQEFFKNILNLTREIPILDAFHLSSSQYSPVKVVLRNPKDKSVIFKNANKLKGKKNEDDRFY